MTFAQFGEIASCNVVRDRLTNENKGYGFVHFVHPESASRAQSDQLRGSIAVKVRDVRAVVAR